MNENIILKIHEIANEILELSTLIAKEKHRSNNSDDVKVMEELSDKLFRIQSELRYDCEIDAKFLWE